MKPVEEFDEFVESTADNVSIHGFRFIRQTLFPENILTPVYFGEGVKQAEERHITLYCGAEMYQRISEALGEWK